MASDRLLGAVRRQLRLGRLLPLGAREDGAWLAERAAGWVLRRSVADGVADVRLDRLRVGPADDEDADAAPAVPPPPSALPPGRLRIEAACAAGLERPLPECVRQVRAVLATAARERLGLDLAGIDVHVAGLLEPPDGERKATAPAGDPLTLVPPQDDNAAVGVAETVLAVPGVLGFSGALGGPSQALRVIDTPSVGTRGAAHGNVRPDGARTDGQGPPPGRLIRLVRLQLAVATGRQTAAVARQARAAAAKAAKAGAPGPVAVTVLITQLADANSDPPA